MKAQHIFFIKELLRTELEEIFELAEKIENSPENYAEKCKGKILATLFFETSTRTRLSFESAMLRLGGQILGFSSEESTSSKKGESVSDTIRMINGYADIAVIRHYLEGVREVVKEYATIPMISGGTGTQAHPTQGMLDLYTIRKHFKKLDGLNVGIMGDLKYGRTIPSILYGLSKFNDIKFYLIAPTDLQIRTNVEIRLKNMNVNYEMIEHVSDVIDKLDVLYVTRLQKERFFDPLDYERLKGSYKITKELLKDVKDDFIILHPLPRVDEIAYEVDQLKCAKYFEQAKNGVWVRMALILKLLGVE